MTQQSLHSLRPRRTLAADRRSAHRSQSLAVVLALFFSGASLAVAESKSSDAVASALEQRLHAPCCRHLLLDAHESETASAMRTEIRDRLRAGDTSAAIEADFVARYGPSIVAIPANRDPRGGLSAVVAWTLGIAALGLVLLGLVWVRRTRRATAVSESPSFAPNAELDAKLDDELRRFDT